MTVKEIMHGITLVEPGTSIREIGRIMRDKNIGSVLIKVDPLHWGIVTERDIVTKVVAKGLDPRDVKASDIMTELRYTIDAGASVQKASEIFNLHHIRRLPVMEDGEIIGMITARDVAKYCAFKSLKYKREYGRGSSSLR
jgi:CBS domain-containing protein